MKLLFLSCITVMSSALYTGASAQVILAPYTITTKTKDVSRMQPSDIAYADAMEFARFLNQHGFTVHSVHRSKLEGIFRGVNKAAFIQTDKGIIEVIFFAESRDAEKLEVIQQTTGGRYIYTFRGQPDPKPGDGINANRPVYFIKHQNWLIVIDDQGLEKALKEALGQ